MRLALIVHANGEVACAARIPLAMDRPNDLGVTAEGTVVLAPDAPRTPCLRLEHREGDWTACKLQGAARVETGGVALRKGPRIVGPPVDLRIGDLACSISLDQGDDDASTREAAFRLVEHFARPRRRPCLRIAEGKGIGRHAVLEDNRTLVVGRGTDADLFLEDPDVSRRHLTLERRGARVLVTDLGSSTGTYLGKARLVPGRSAIWDTSRMVLAGKTVLLLEATDDELIVAAEQEATERLEVPRDVAPTSPAATREADASLEGIFDAHRSTPPPRPKRSGARATIPNTVLAVLLAVAVVGALSLAGWVLLSGG